MRALSHPARLRTAVCLHPLTHSSTSLLIHRGSHPLKGKIAPDRVRKLVERRVEALRKAARERGRRAAAKSKETQDALASILRLDMDASMTCRETLCAVLAVEVRSPAPKSSLLLPTPLQVPAAHSFLLCCVVWGRTWASTASWAKCWPAASRAAAWRCGGCRCRPSCRRSWLRCAAHAPEGNTRAGTLLTRAPPLSAQSCTVVDPDREEGLEEGEARAARAEEHLLLLKGEHCGLVPVRAAPVGAMPGVALTHLRRCAAGQAPLRADRVGRAVEAATASPDQYMPPPRRAKQ